MAVCRPPLALIQNIMRGFLFSAAAALLLMAPAAESAGKSDGVTTSSATLIEAAEKRVAPYDEAVTTPSATTKEDTPDKVEQLDSAIVSSSRAGKSTPVTFTTVSAGELRKADPLYSLPMLLAAQPSVVTTNEGGTGLGYSKMTIRGSKGSQINVTLNGITLNDSESQEVFWVNIPSLTNILNSVQLQRGLGTSANGAGAFGGSVNMSTASVGSQPFASFDIARGSFNTLTTSVAAGTGLLPSGFYFNAAYSKNTTDGYIRNAWADVQSAFAALGWLKGDNSLKLTWLMGDQHTGITWNGEPYANYLKGDYKYNSAGEHYDSFGNVSYYDNDSDNYTQNHLQLNYTHQFSDALIWSTTLNYTKGDGYYEEYKDDAKVTKYGFSSPLTATDGNSYEKGDFIIHKSMDNAYYALSTNLHYSSEMLTVTGGAYLSAYDGDHFGEVLWSDLLGDEYAYGSHWYDNNGLKKELNLFGRAEWSPVERLTAFADLQYRGVSLTMSGADDDNDPLDYDKNWNFFNPRAGVTFDFTEKQKVYASLALGHREPGRGDLKENIKSAIAQKKAGSEDTSVSLQPERMVDVEVGYAFTGERFSANANIYLMEYKNMLLETGRLSSTGYAIKENVPESYRRGIELSAAWTPSQVFRFDANTTLSVNKIKDYTAWFADYDNQNDWNPTGQYSQSLGKVDMLLSPSVIAAGQATVKPFAAMFTNSLKTTTISLGAKYVGKQYWDNTGSSDREIPGYFTANLSVSHEFSLKEGKLGLSGYVNNLFNKRYYADAWVYRAHFNDGSWYQEEGVFPQAPVNFILKVSYRF